MQTIESVFPPATSKTRIASIGNEALNRYGRLAAALAVAVPLFAVGSVNAVLWLLNLWVGMADSLPLLFAQ